MGQSTSFFFRPSTEDANIFGMAERDVGLVERSWHGIRDKELLGRSIFHRIFTLEPKLKRSFHFEGIPRDELDANPRFQSHAGNFVQFLDTAATNLRTESGRALILRKTHEFGGKHAELAAFDSSIFDPEYWMFFINSAMTELSLAKGGRRDTRSKSSWQLLLTRLVLEMKVSFYKEMLRIYTSTDGRV